MLADQLERHYVKTRPDALRGNERNFSHIHVDSQELLSAEATDALLSSGFTYDLFDVDFHVNGKDGDPTRPFPHFAPAQHMTFVTSNADRYREAWDRAVEIVTSSYAKCYIEGELIVLDEPLPSKPFDMEAFERLVPEVDPAEAGPFAYRSAITNAWRSLPVAVSLRRLDPKTNGRRDQFRRGECHITLRDDVHPLLLETLCNFSFSVPAIPKMIEGHDGKLERNADGSFRVIRDIPLTLQTTDMREMMQVVNVAMLLIEAVGGVADGSVKIEFATHFSILNGVDYGRFIPPVLAKAEFRPDFARVDHNKLGSIDANLARLTLDARKAMKSTPHHDKIARFREIWSRTLGTNSPS